MQRIKRSATLSTPKPLIPYPRNNATFAPPSINTAKTKKHHKP